jgi:predicted nucleic acid-binding protein
MAHHFFDSSGLVKRYNSETGTSWVLGIYRPSHRQIIHIAQISLVEVTAALTRRARGNKLTTNYQRVIRRFERDVQSRFSVYKISDKVIAEAVNLAKKHGLRGYDAVQLTVALEITKELNLLGFSPLTFVSADNDLNTAAKTESLTVENPNNYP